MNKLYTYLLLGLVALPIAGFTGGVITSEKANAATKSDAPTFLANSNSANLDAYSILFTNWPYPLPASAP